MTASAAAPAADPAATMGEVIEPGSRAALLDRAACMFKARGMGEAVEFAYFHAGQETRYFARWVWAQDEGAPRVLVFDAWSGFFVCQSQQGQPFDLDRVTFGCDVGEDEGPRDLWLRQQAQKARP